MIFERVISLEIDIADLVGGQFNAVIIADMHDAKVRLAHRAGLFQPFVRVDNGHAIALGACVIFHEDGAEPVDHRLFDRHRARGRGMDGQFQARNIIFGAHLVGQFQHTDEMGRHPLAVRHTITVDGGQSGFGIVFFHHHDRAAQMLDRHRPAQRGRMIERCRTQIDAVLIGFEAGLGHHSRHRHGGDIAIGGQFGTDALGTPCCARRIQHFATSNLVGDTLSRHGRGRLFPRPEALDGTANGEQAQVRKF